MPDLLRLLQRFAFRPKVHRTGQQKLTCWPVANLESWDLQCYWSFCKKGSLPLIPPLHTQRSPTKLQNHFIFAFALRWVLLFCSMVASWPTLDLVGYLVIRMSGKHLFFLGTVALWLDLIALLTLNLGWTCSVLGTARQRRSDLCAKCNLSYSLSEAPKDNLLTNPTLIEVGCSKLGGMAAIWPRIIFPSMYMLDWLLAELSTLTGGKAVISEAFGGNTSYWSGPCLSSLPFNIGIFGAFFPLAPTARFSCKSWGGAWGRLADILVET